MGGGTFNFLSSEVVINKDISRRVSNLNLKKSILLIDSFDCRVFFESQRNKIKTQVNS